MGQTRERSAELFARAERVLVGGVNSPVRAFRAVGGDPVFLRAASGARVTDVDGNEYVDLVGSWGPAIVGHAHPEVVAAVSDAAARGLSFGACHEAEAELAELILGALPGAEVLRFVSSGTEATMSALRLARGVTGRPLVVKLAGNYHGHVDSLLVAAGSGAATFGTPDSAGVPEHAAASTAVLPYGDLAAAEALLSAQPGRVAAIIVEPIAGNMGFVRPPEGYLAGLRALADQSGALLVFDEVMTGFRVAWGGEQARVGVRPDLSCLGKVIGGGLPVAAYTGRRELMAHVSPLGPVYQAGTLSGNPLGMAAGLATLRLLSAEGVYERLHDLATRLATGLAAAGASAGVPLSCDAQGGMLGMFFRDALPRDFAEAQTADHRRFARFFRGMLDRGVWLPPSGYEAMFLSLAHDELDVDAVVTKARATLASMSAEETE